MAWPPRCLKPKKMTPEQRILRAARTRLHSALKSKGIKKNVRTLELIGCSGPQLRQYLEARFKPGMTWDNYGFTGWHVDHIRPCSSFDLVDPEQLRACFHYTNLQPLWARENFKKSATWDPCQERDNNPARSERESK